MKEKKSKAKKPETKKPVDTTEYVDEPDKKYSIFDHWANLTTKKEGYKEDDMEFVKSYSPYMINKFASTINALLPLVAEVEKYSDLTPKAHHMFYDSIIPKRFLKFESFKKKSDTADEAEDKKYVKDYFEFGKRDLELAMKILKTEDIEKIKRKYGGSR